MDLYLEADKRLMARVETSGGGQEGMNIVGANADAKADTEAVGAGDAER